MDRQCRPSMNVCLCVCFHVHLGFRGLCFHMRVNGTFTVNPGKKGAACVFVSARARGRRKEGSVLIFKSSRRVPRIKYLGRRSLDLLVLAETPGSN